jgi:hypothetical protein
MQSWAGEMQAILARVLGHPQTVMDLWALGLIALLSLFLVFKLVIGAAGAADNRSVRLLVSLVLGGLVLLAGAGASAQFLLPKLGHSLPGSMIALGLPILVSLAVAVPLQSLLLRTSYIHTLFAYAASVAVTMLTLMSANSVLAAIHDGDDESARLRAYNRSVEQLIEDTR